MNVHPDAFSSGQIESKLWLCENLELLFDKIDNIWIYGGWYAIAALLLRTRNNIKIKQIRSYDIDPYCEYVADGINENWKWKNWQFKAHTQDCNQLVPVDVDLIINTSVEHFKSRDWWHNIPKGTTVALQANNMQHDDHYSCYESLETFVNDFPVTEILFRGSLDFVYPQWQFTRYMLIGIK